jgi:hypothetical protein
MFHVNEQRGQGFGVVLEGKTVPVLNELSITP